MRHWKAAMGKGCMSSTSARHSGTLWPCPGPGGGEGRRADVELTSSVDLCSLFVLPASDGTLDGFHSRRLESARPWAV